MAGVTDIYKQGYGEASLLPQKDLSGTIKEEYRKELAKGQEQEQALGATIKGLGDINADAWEIDAPEYNVLQQEAKDKIAEEIVKNKIPMSAMPALVDKYYRPIIEEKKASAKQRADFMAAAAAVRGDKEGKYDTEAFETNVEIYKNPKKAALTNPIVAKQLEDAKGNVVLFRGLYGNQYLQAPIRYDDIKYQTEDAFKGVEEVPVLKSSTYTDPTTKKLRVTTYKGKDVNYAGLLDRVDKLETAAAGGDPKAKGFWQSRYNGIVKNFDIQNVNGVPKIIPKEGTQGKEIQRIAQTYYKDLYNDPKTTALALARADALNIGIQQQKREANRTDQFIALNDTGEGDDGQGVDVDQLLETVSNTDIVVDAGGRESGTQWYAGRSMQKKPVYISLNENVVSTKGGVIPKTGKSVEFIPDYVGVTNIYNPNTTIFDPDNPKSTNNKRADNTPVPTYNYRLDKGKYSAKPMVRGLVRTKDEEGDDVEFTAYVPLSIVKEGYLGGLNEKDAANERNNFVVVEEVAKRKNQKLKPATKPSAPANKSKSVSFPEWKKSNPNGTFAQWKSQNN